MARLSYYTRCFTNRTMSDAQCYEIQMDGIHVYTYLFSTLFSLASIVIVNFNIQSSRVPKDETIHSPAYLSWIRSRFHTTREVFEVKSYS